MSQTCATCRHSYPIDPAGHWGRNSFDHAAYAHCKRSDYGKAQVMAKTSACGYVPSRWEGRIDRG